MNLLQQQLYYLNKKVLNNDKKNSLSVFLKFYVTLNQEQENSGYFSFFCNGGNIKIVPAFTVESGKKLKIFINSVPVIIDEYFYLGKGKKTVKITADFSAEEKLLFYVYGDVSYLDEMIIKSVNFSDVSYIFSSCDGEIKLYKYDGQSLAMIENLGESPSGDICRGDLLYLCYIVGEDVKVKIYYKDLSCVELATNAEGQEVKCDYQEKLRLYVVKGNVLSCYEYSDGTFTKLDFKKRADKIYAIKGNRAVIKDCEGKIRLCFNLFEE